ncbi:hypothetical protein [Segetibacter koreensis]|uniref:hypothetical protein n=1 Tax=Segetibacter koreensis TaxID=398037 RepID=UPI000382D204|nr:hypothetical protein [Segetibacter koreensis]
MNESEKELSSEESLKLINRMIHEAKGYFHESGLGALVYGFGVLLCSLLAYAVDVKMISFPFSPFYLLVPVFFVQSLIHWRENKMKKAKTFTDETIDYVWTGFFLSAIAAFSANFAGKTYVTITIILFLAGFATFLTGMIAKFNYHKISGIICLLLASVSFFMQDAIIYLLLAITAAMVWIIPGFILNMTFKKQQYAR